MGSLSYSHTLTAGTPENINDVQDMFEDVQTLVNGNLDATNLATTAKPVTLLGRWDTVASSWLEIVGTGTAGTYGTSLGGGTTKFPATVTGAPWPFLSLRSADFAVSGLTPVLRVKMATLVNDTAPAITFTGGLYLLSVSGASGSALIYQGGTVISGSTAAQASPAAGSELIAVSSNFAIPADGNYALAVATSGTMPTNACLHAALQLEVKYT